MTEHRAPQQSPKKDDPYLDAAKANLLKFKSLQATYYLKIAEEIIALRGHFESGRSAIPDVDVWLQTEAGFTAVEAKTFASFDKELATSTLLRRRGMSPDAIVAIAKADQKTRAESLIYLERNEPIDASWVRSRASANSIAAMSPDDLAEFRRAELFQETSEQHAAMKLAEIERGAAELLDLIDSAVAAGSGVERIYSFSPTAETDASFPVNSRAARVLSELDELFGGRPRVYDRPADADRFFYQPSPKHVALASVSFSYKSLYDLQRGTITPENLVSDDWFKPRRCLAFLAGRRASAVPDKTAQGLPWSPSNAPTFVDIDTGAGGAALGFVAAGMYPLRVLARTEHEFTAVSSNPVPNVELIVEGLDNHLLSLKGQEIDLLTSGMPFHHYEIPEAKKAFQNALDAVELLKPKVFLFETLPREKDGYMAGSFESKGYEVRWHTLDSAEYGLVQAKNREVLIGALKGQGLLDRLVMPVLRARPQLLASAIGDLVAGHVWSGEEPTEERDAHRAQVQAWLKKCGAEPAPHFPNPFEKRAAPLWRGLGINIKRPVRNPPSLDDFRLESGFFLSTEMIKRIQGYPAGWHVEAAEYSIGKEVAGSFPPVMAKMAGLAIHTALTGVAFDHERAFWVPLLRANRSRIHPEEFISRIPRISEAYADPNRAFKIRETQRRREIDLPHRPYPRPTSAAVQGSPEPREGPEPDL
ncbi:DNA cytosine methyltransferase [Rhizobium leguminosarum]|uniref:DNA cytosine methyltransferase n=1 Tax=Rhizobium leguminosarum TaxID=384 RepID=UPI001030F288|nr:DNA cytosine methyltransferase [Rhizobium leguminosarum]TAY17106.1 DNA cytosine methyltransferase [Rhizobium leguminosarum]